MAPETEDAVDFDDDHRSVVIVVGVERTNGQDPLEAAVIRYGRPRTTLSEVLVNEGLRPCPVPHGRRLGIGVYGAYATARHIRFRRFARSLGTGGNG
jgi:hypothetical protein